ncbi:hypothetical protein XH89_32625 [Bradyrhizobium sp. CCBAU 53340]|nr:hypothetical protein XH89_32625 [Bradyrhizobium sp. CCBAU 53340]
MGDPVRTKQAPIVTAAHGTGKRPLALLPCRQGARQKNAAPVDAATDGDRLGRLIGDGGPDQTQLQPNPVM